VVALKRHSKLSNRSGLPQLVCSKLMVPRRTNACFTRLIPHSFDTRRLENQTGVVLTITSQGVVGASVGDSGAWVIRADDYIDLTSCQHRKPLLGSGRAMVVGFSQPSITGTLLVASDGLFKYAKAESICQTVRENGLQEAPECLVSLAKLRSGELQDDVAIALCGLA
jgi:serine/threonine protein phosphatase PrpC